MLRFSCLTRESHKGASDAVYVVVHARSNRSPSPTPTTLAAAFARVPDPRRPHGRRFSLAAILALAVVALLSNHLSVLAIAQWGKRQSPAVLAALGFPEGITPHQTTMQRLFRKLDPCPSPLHSPNTSRLPLPRTTVRVAVTGSLSTAKRSGDGLPVPTSRSIPSGALWADAQCSAA
ncbi:MAG: transposase family protein [Thermomicrobiales bacterium]